MDNYQPYFNLGELIAKYLQDELTDREKKELDSWLKANPANEDTFNKLINVGILNQQLDIYSSANKDAAWNNIVKKTGYHKNTKRKYSLVIPLSAAAAFLLLLTVGILAGRFFSKKENPKVAVFHKPDLLPGSNKAILTLANGAKIVLDDAKNGRVASQQNILISKLPNGQLVYSTNQNNLVQGEIVKNTLLTFNTIVTPRGGQIEVVLSDGTKVWLNAASSLKYPTAFTGNNRQVELSGEAYFEVAKNAAKPFSVKTANQTVEVTGTHFNINSYTDEMATKTTLLEGSVNVAGNTGTRLIKLQPGQQAVNTNGQLHVIYNADTEEAMAWKNGKFVFHDTDLHAIMRQLSRWYDVDVEYQGTIAERHYRGRISRNVPVSQLFEILQTSGLNFTINGRKIIVKS